MISASSVPANSPLSFLGFRARTAMRGLSMYRSRLSVFCSVTIFSMMVSRVMAGATLLMGRFSVARAMRSGSAIIMVSDFLSAATFCRMYSAWVAAPWAVEAERLNGAVTSTSSLPAWRSSSARSRAVRAAVSASGVALPYSILSSSSPKQFTMFTVLSCTSSMDARTLKLVWLLMALRW